MIEVRIRLESEGVSVHLCEWPATGLDSLLPTIRRWGIAGHEGDLSGQFVLDEDAAHFEVLVGDVDE